METQWYLEYFKEPYGEIYAEYLLAPAITRREAEFGVKALGLGGGDTVLDCPCGFARHEPYLAARTRRYVGLDLEADCLRRAGRVSPSALLARGDMRCLPLASRSFDAVVNLFNSFGYFTHEENAKALGEFARVLRPGGRVLLDLANPRTLVEALEHCPRTEQAVADLVISEQWNYESGSGILANQTVIRIGGERFDRSYRLHVYSLADLKALLARAGLRFEKAYGEFDGVPFKEKESGRLIVVARRG